MTETALNQPWLRRRAFVGRDEELKRLGALFQAARAGQGGVVMLVGDPGIGKTALCEEFARTVASHGGLALVGHCYEHTALGVPYQAFVEAIGSYVRQRDPDQLRPAIIDIARLVPTPRDKFQVEPDRQVDPADDRLQLLAGVVEFLRKVSDTQPLVLTLEDLHDADRGTLDLLLYLTRHVETLRLLVVGTYRDVEVERSHPLSAALSDLRRSSRYLRLQLRGLTVNGVQELLAATTQQAILQPFAELLHRRTDGNPLFVHETLRFLVENGLVERRDGVLRRVGEQSLAGRIPEGLRDVVGKRLSHLSVPTNNVLSTAAVIGTEFQLDVLGRVHAATEQELICALEEAVAAAVLDEHVRVGGMITYHFTHAFIRQSLYEEIIAPRRLRLHREIAHAIEEVHARRLVEHSGELAEHFAFSTDTGDLEKAVHYGALAAQNANRVFAYSEAVRLLERALQVQDLIDPDDRAKRCDLLLALGEALFPSGDTSRAIEIASQTFGLAEQLKDRSRAFRACRLALDSHDAQAAMTAAGRSEYFEWAERAIECAEAGTVEQIHADLAMAHALYVRGRTSEARALRLGALASAREIKDKEALFKAAFFLLNVGPMRHWGEGLTLANEAVSWSRDGVGPRGQSLVLWNAGLVHLAWGDRRRAEGLWSDIEQLADQTHSPTARLFTHCTAAILATLDGRLEESLSHLDLLVRQSEEFGASARGRQFDLQARLLALSQLARAEEWLLALQAFAGIEGAVTTLQALPPYEALCLAQMGREDEADSLVGVQLDAEVAADDRDERSTSVLVNLLELAVLLRHRAAAASLSARLADLADLTFTEWYCTCVARHLGAAAALCGDRRAAEAYYVQALEVATRIRFRPEIAIIHLQFAELLSEDADEGRRAEVHSHLEFAIDEFRAMNMQLALDRALRLKPDDASPRKKSRDALTAREREIAGLLALGKSNREIATTLVISEGTVEVHAKHILSKLGLRSRTQMVAKLASQRDQK